MGIIGPALFDNDLVADIRDKYRTFLEHGLDDSEALRRILKQYKRWFDREDGTGPLVGFAVTQSELGRLDAEIRNQAIAAIDRGGDLRLWEESRPRMVQKRQAVLAEARALLSGPQPDRVVLQPPAIRSCDLVAGDALAVEAKSQYVIFLVTRVAPVVLERLEYGGSNAPSLKVLQRLRPRDVPSKTGRLLYREQFLLNGKTSDWKELGFQKIGRIDERKEESQKPVVHKGRVLTWSKLFALVHD